MSDSGLRQQNEGLLKLVQTMEEYSRELEARLARTEQAEDEIGPTKAINKASAPRPLLSDTPRTASSPGSKGMSAVLEEENTELLRLLNDERRRSKELEVQLKRERTLKEELAKESLSQLSSSLTALQSQATAAIAQSRGISRTLQQEMDAARAALAEKDLLITKVKETLLNELVRLQRVYEGREEELGLQSEELRGQLDKILTLNVAKDAVYAQEKQAMLAELQAANSSRLAKEAALTQEISQEVESILRLQISVLRANVEELSVEVVRLKTVAESSRNKPPDPQVVSDLKAALAEEKRLRDEALESHDLNLREVLAITHHSAKLEQMSVLSELQTERDKNESLSQALDILQQRYNDLVAVQQGDQKRIADLGSTLNDIHSTQEVEIAAIKSDAASRLQVMQRELDVLKADYASQGAVLATLKEALARSEKQLSDTASSKAHEITELEGLVSRMQASISGEKERSARLLAVQSQELVVAKSVCKAREADLAVLSETHRQMEESLRAALSQANDALRACEAQKGSIESTTFSTLREMQEKLDQESLLHEAAEQSAAKAISGYQAQIQLLTEEVNFTKSDAEQRIAAVNEACQAQLDRAKAEKEAYLKSQKDLEKILKDTKAAAAAERIRYEGEIESAIGLRDAAVSKAQQVETSHAAAVNALEDTIKELKARLQSVGATERKAIAGNSAACADAVKSFLASAADRVEVASAEDPDPASNRTHFARPAGEVSPSRRSTRSVVKLMSAVHEATIHSLMPMELFRRSIDAELSSLRESNATSMNSLALLNQTWEKERKRLSTENEAAVNTLAQQSAAVQESSAEIEVCLSTLRDACKRWAADDSDRDVARSQYFESVTKLDEERLSRVHQADQIAVDFKEFCASGRMASLDVSSTLGSLATAVLKLVEEAGSSKASDTSFLSNLRQNMSSMAATLEATTAKHEAALIQEISMLREQLLETQQAKVDGELSLLTEKRELLQELQVLKSKSDEERSLVNDAIRMSRQRWESIAADREALILRDLTVARAQIAKVRDVSKDMEFVCKSERELSLRTVEAARKTLTSERTFVSHERNTFFTFLNTIQMHSSVMLKSLLSEMEALQTHIETIWKLANEKDALFAAKLKTLEESRGLRDVESLAKLRAQDDADMQILVQEIQRLSSDLDEARRQGQEKEALTLDHIQTLSSGLHALSETFQAFMSEGPGTVGDSPPSNGGTSSLGSPLASPRGGVFMDAQQGFLTTAAGEEEDDDGPPAPKALVPASHGTPM